MTYDLRDDYLELGYGEAETAEFDSPLTIEGIEGALIEAGHEVTRIGTVRALTTRLSAGERWDLVFNIAEGLHGVSREAQVPALLEAFDIPYVFSDPLTCALTLDKAMAKRVVRDHAIPTAQFYVAHHSRALPPSGMHFPMFVKPLAEGTGKGISADSYVTTTPALRTAVSTLLNRHHQPVLIEEYLPGREFTVGIIGNGDSARAIGVMEVLPGNSAEAHGYTYENKEHYELHMHYRLARDREAQRAARTALAAWRALRCRDGGRLDLRSDAAGIPHFLEVNPLAGLHPLRSDLVILAGMVGMDYQQLIGSILDAAVRRLNMENDVDATIRTASAA